MWCRRTQRDPVAAVEMLRRLAFSGVRVVRTDGASARSSGTSFAAGTWVVPADQEFAALAREVLDVQKYPEIREIARRSARYAVRCGRLDAAAADGRAHHTVTTPLSTEARAKMRMLGSGAGSRRAARAVQHGHAHATPRRSTAPGHRLRHGSRRARDRAAAGPHHRNRPGARRQSGARTTRSARSIARGGRRDVRCALRRVPSGRYVDHRPHAGGAGRTGDVARAPRRARRRALAPARRSRASALFLANTSMDEGWTRWVLDAVRVRVRARVRRRTSRPGNLRNRIDVLLIADERAACWAAARDEAAGPAAPRRGAPGPQRRSAGQTSCA